MSGPTTATGRKVVAIYGSGLLDDVLGIEAEARMAHTIRWFGIIPGTRERIPRTRFMPGRHWGWDVVCSCDWESRTGGATQASVRRLIADHRWDTDLA